MGDQAKSSKKNLADMSREELMEKCKNLLLLAQKAKAAKDGEWMNQMSLNQISQNQISLYQISQNKKSLNQIFFIQMSKI